MSRGAGTPTPAGEKEIDRLRVRTEPPAALAWLRHWARMLGNAAVRGFLRVCRWCLAVARAMAPVGFHVAVVALSAGLALSIPFFVRRLATDLLLNWWTLVENEKLFLTGVEIVAAALLITLFNAMRSWAEDRQLARAAREAGICHATSSRGWLARRMNQRLREKQSTGKEVMLIGSTGFRTFARPDGHLHTAIRKARQSRILLLNPESEGARTRARAMLNPEMTPGRFAEQLQESIAFLKQLRTAQKDVRLKLYSHPPFLKLAILGDYAWLQHYHAGLDVAEMPEFVFQYDQTPERLYVVLYQYFLQLWNNPEIPEYDLEADTLVYRDGLGNEINRVAAPWGAGPPGALAASFDGAAGNRESTLPC